KIRIVSSSLIAAALRNNRILANQMSLDAWIADQEARAEKVQLFRDYADGDHRAALTAEMKALLRIGNSDAPFSDNRLDNVIQTVVDRLEVQRIEDTSGA